MTTRQEAIDGVNRLFDRIEADGRTIPLRIRVGVTASGEWSAVGGSKRVLEAYTYGADTSITDDLANAAEEDVAAWHWITAEVPMPETEQGDVAGEVEQPCAGMPSDQKGAK